MCHMTSSCETFLCTVLTQLVPEWNSTWALFPRFVALHSQGQTSAPGGVTPSLLMFRHLLFPYGAVDICCITHCLSLELIVRIFIQSIILYWMLFQSCSIWWCSGSLVLFIYLFIYLLYIFTGYYIFSPQGQSSMNNSLITSTPTQRKSCFNQQEKEVIHTSSL